MRGVTLSKPKRNIKKLVRYGIDDSTDSVPAYALVVSRYAPELYKEAMGTPKAPNW